MVDGLILGTNGWTGDERWAELLCRYNRCIFFVGSSKQHRTNTMKLTKETPVGTEILYCGETHVVTRPIFSDRWLGSNLFVDYVYLRPINGKKAFCIPTAYVNVPQIQNAKGKWTIDVAGVKAEMGA